MAKCKLNKARNTELQAALDEYSKARETLHDLLDTIADDWNSEFDDSSERWQDGDGGQEARERIEQVEAARDQIADEIELDPDSLT